MIVVGDIHGCFKTLMALVKKMPDKQLIAVGDLIDRGPQSKEVINFFIKNNHYSVMGNHEDMMTDINARRLWLANGGINTLRSYESGNGNYVDELEIHEDWVEKLPLIIEYKNFIISHSAVFHCWNVDQQSTDFIENALWCRNFLGLENTLPEGSVNIFGHSPVEKVLREKNFINIDCGCVFKRNNYSRLGTLVAYDMDTDIFYEQENIED